MELYTVDHGERYVQLHTLWMQLDGAVSDDEYDMIDTVRELLLQHLGR